MECGRCGVRLEEGESREHAGQELCEDCYIEVLTETELRREFATLRHLELLRGQKQRQQVLITLF